MKKIELLKQPGYIYDLFSLFVSYYNRAEANYGGGADEGRGEKRQFFPAVRRLPGGASALLLDQGKERLLYHRKFFRPV